MGEVKCVYCGFVGSHVVDSRQAEDGSAIRRRRECEKCGRRFTTFEKVETVPLMVIKKDKTREIFNADKLRRGIIKACEKRPVSIAQIDDVVADIEKCAYQSSEPEITSGAIGEMVMEELKELDEVAYVRFSCVYHEFHDLQTFVKEVERMILEKQGNADSKVR